MRRPRLPRRRGHARRPPGAVPLSAQPDFHEAYAPPPAPHLVAVPREVAPHSVPSPLRAARVRRKLTEEQAAERAGLFPDEVRWLEEGRVYRFRSPDDAVLAAALYTASLGISQREARRLAGLAAPPADWRRIARLGVAAALAAAVVLAILLPAMFGRGAATPATPAPSHRAAAGPALPPPRALAVDVLNGSGDINWTARVAARIRGLGYPVKHLLRASRFDYPDTAVYFEPGGSAVAARLARQLGVAAKPLPGGTNPRRLVVIVGPQRGPG